MPLHRAQAQGWWLVSEPPDVDRLLRSAARLEQQSEAMPAWTKGTIVFADAPQIVGVAIRLIGGEVVSLPAPARHVDVIRKIHAEAPEWRMRQGDEQGFMWGDRFVTRRQALAIVKRNGQLTKPLIGGGVLTSEDLW